MKKKMTREERAEIKGGKYTGGPAEEKAEMKKKSKRMMDGGMASMGRGAGLPRGLAKRDAMPPGLARMPALPAGLGARPATTMTGLGARPMRGGGLARKGVGMALAKGGLAKADRMSRVKTKGKMC